MMHWEVCWLPASTHSCAFMHCRLWEQAVPTGWVLVQSIQISGSGSRSSCFSQQHPSAGCSGAGHAGLDLMMPHYTGTVLQSLSLQVTGSKRLRVRQGSACRFNSTPSGLTRTNKHSCQSLLETILCEKRSWSKEDSLSALLCDDSPLWWFCRRIRLGINLSSN